MPTEAELLADLLDGKVDAADVPAELAELAELADAVSQHITLVPPTDAFREALREQVVQSAGGPGGTTGAAGGGSSTGSATTTATTTGAAASGGISAIIAGVAATAVLATSVVAAADRAGPGDLLAGLDRGLESAQLALADDQREAELLVDFAAERVLEAVDQVDAAVVSDLLQRADELLQDALALGVAQRRDLEALVSPLTASLRTLASRTEDPAVEAQIAQLLDELGEPLGLDGPSAGGGGAPADSGTTDAPADPQEDPDGQQAPQDGSGDGDQPTDDGGEADDLTDPLDELDDPLDELDDPVDELDDPVDELDEPVDELDDTVDDVTGELDDTGDAILGD